MQNQIAKMLIDMARFYGFDLEERRLEMYVGVLSQFPSDIVLEAGKRYVQDIKNNRFPMPPHIILKEYIPQNADSRQLAVLTAGKVREAIKKFGWCNQKDARAHIGEAGWRVIEQFGGWLHLCENLGVEIQETTFFAQFRDAVEASVDLEAIGFDPDRPALEQSKERKQGLQSAGEIIGGLLPGRPK